MMWGPGGGGWSGEAWLTMGLVMAAVWAVAIWALVTLVRRPGRLDPARPPIPERILAERYARGELTTAEFEEQLTTLRAAQPD